MTLWVLCEHGEKGPHDVGQHSQQSSRCPGGREASIEDVKAVVNRFEVIDHTSTGEGRWPSKWEDFNFQVVLSLQDGGRTLKVFLTPALDQDYHDYQRRNEAPTVYSDPTPALDQEAPR